LNSVLAVGTFVTVIRVISRYW